MDLGKALEQHRASLDKAEIVVVTSDNTVYLLNKESEIARIEKHAADNKLECLVLKNTLKKAETVKVEAKKVVAKKAAPRK